jgi:metal-responsive CopG/Arc/MetJ family transcriptional regulator
MVVKSVSIRIEEEMLKKLDSVVKYEGRSLNSHILVLVRESITKYEEQHGKIDGDISLDKNAKPARK